MSMTKGFFKYVSSEYVISSSSSFKLASGA